MRAHLLDEEGFIVNTIEVDHLEQLENLVDAELGGTIGDRFVDGLLVKINKQVPATGVNAPILAALEVIDAKTARAVREALVTGDKSRVQQLETDAGALRAQLVKV